MDELVADRNEVRVTGRLSGEPQRRTLPSGDELLALRVVVTRPGGGVDTVPVQLGPAPAPGGRPAAGQLGRRVLARAASLAPGTRVHVEGELRRRWWRVGTRPASRVEVHAASIEPVDEPA